MRRLEGIVTVLSSLILALGVLALALALFGRPPQTTLFSMLNGAFGSTYGWSETLLRTVPVLLCALAAILPAQAGQINIGGDGQFHLGAIGAVLIGGSAIGLKPGAMWLMVLAAIVFGAAWAAIPGALRAWLGVSEALVSLFLNYVALSLLHYLIHGPLRDPSSFGWAIGSILPDNLLLSTFGRTRLHSGIFVVLPLAAFLIIFLYVTRTGTEIRAVGLNPRTSAAVGIPIRRYLFLTMALGGALAGLAGYYEIASVQERLRMDISVGFGYSGFLVAWICREQLILILPVSVLVAGLIVGSENLQITSGLPAASGDVVQGLLLLFVLLHRPVAEWFVRRRAINQLMEQRTG